MDFLPLKSSFQSSAPQTVTLPDRMSNHLMLSGTKHNSSQCADVLADHVWANFTRFSQDSKLKYKELKRNDSQWYHNSWDLQLALAISVTFFLEPSACKVPDKHFHGGMKRAAQRARPLPASYFKCVFLCVCTVDRIRLHPGLQMQGSLHYMPSILL